MSMSIFLVPLAIALCISAAETVDAVSYKCKNQSNSEEFSSLIQTRFNDLSLLKQTLVEHGLNVQVMDANSLIVSCSGGILKYTRSNDSEPFYIQLKKVENVDCLVEELNELENEYDRNVQSFTYHKVLDNLPPEMSVVEDTILEDDTILLTLSVKD